MTSSQNLCHQQLLRKPIGARKPKQITDVWDKWVAKFKKPNSKTHKAGIKTTVDYIIQYLEARTKNVAWGKKGDVAKLQIKEWFPGNVVPKRIKEPAEKKLVAGYRNEVKTWVNEFRFRNDGLGHSSSDYHSWPYYISDRGYATHQEIGWGIELVQMAIKHHSLKLITSKIKSWGS